MKYSLKYKKYKIIYINEKLKKDSEKNLEKGIKKDIIDGSQLNVDEVYSRLDLFKFIKKID